MWYEMTSKGGTEEKNAYKILVTETERRKPLERTKCGWKENNLLQHKCWIPLDRIASYTVLLTMPFPVKTFPAKFVLNHFIIDRV
jgi:hypothetical protein